MYEYLNNHWKEITRNCLGNTSEYYEELLDHYTEAHRQYHNLHHIVSLLQLADTYKDQLVAPQLVALAIWYHDAIYDATQKDNEEQSALLARTHLSKMGFNSDLVQHCYNMIIATKTHTINETKDHTDTGFLLDIDLSILAAEPDNYKKYTEQIRQEYIVYPDILYTAGRKNVLQHFLSKERIYHTDTFYAMWEVQARVNIKNELGSLV